MRRRPNSGSRLSAWSLTSQAAEGKVTAAALDDGLPSPLVGSYPHAMVTILLTKAAKPFGISLDDADNLFERLAQGMDEAQLGAAVELTYALSAGGPVKWNEDQKFAVNMVLSDWLGKPGFTKRFGDLRDALRLDLGLDNPDEPGYLSGSS
jgi:hypothetical protein